jgi:hypothetical protein
MKTNFHLAARHVTLAVFAVVFTHTKLFAAFADPTENSSINVVQTRKDPSIADGMAVIKCRLEDLETRRVVISCVWLFGSDMRGLARHVVVGDSISLVVPAGKYTLCAYSSHFSNVACLEDYSFTAGTVTQLNARIGIGRPELPSLMQSYRLSSRIMNSDTIAMENGTLEVLSVTPDSSLLKSNRSVHVEIVVEPKIEAGVLVVHAFKSDERLPIIEEFQNAPYHLTLPSGTLTIQVWSDKSSTIGRLESCELHHGNRYVLTWRAK